MAKIIYGVAGEGFGHSSRSHLIGQKLIDAGHDVLFVASDKSFSYLQQNFPDKVRKIYGLFFVYRNGKICVLRTFFANSGKFPLTAFKNFKMFQNCLSSFKPDLVITDFEPFTAFWASLNNIPLLSIDHQHLLTNCVLDDFNNNLFAKLNSQFVIKCFRIRENAHIILNFFEAPVKNYSTILSPPVVRPIVRQFESTHGEHILYYSTGKTHMDKMLSILRIFSRQKFCIYGFNRDVRYDNCILKKTSTREFISDLAACRAVIATAGFSLLSECMYFRKKMLLLPVLNQYEQLINANYIQKLNLGFSSLKFDKEILGKFLAGIDEPINVTVKEQVLWPDNDAFFRIFEGVLNKQGHSIQSKPSALKESKLVNF